MGKIETQNLKQISYTLQDIGEFKNESEPDDWSGKVLWDNKILGTSTKSRQKEAHNAIEKKYRQNLNKNFRLLEGILPNRRDEKKSRLPSQEKPIKFSRATILEAAYDEILNLRERVSFLEVKFQTLRQAAFLIRAI